MKSKNYLFIISSLLLLLCVPIFGNAEAEASQSEAFKVGFLYRDSASYPVQKDWLIWDLIEEATGVRMDYISAPASSYDAKRQIIFASGEVPEICVSTGPANAEDVANGLILPVSDYLHMMPNLQNFLNTFDYDLEIYNLTAEDGKWYSLPVKADTKRSSIHSWMIRTDIFDKHEIPYPVTLDDVYEAGLLLKELYPDSSPIINRFGANNILSILGAGYGVGAGWTLSSNGHDYNEESDSYVFTAGSEPYRELLTYVKEMYDTGVLDEEFSMMASSTYEQMVVQGETFILVDWVGNQVRYNVRGKLVDPDFHIWPIIPPKGPYGDYAVGKGSMYEQWWILPASLADHPNLEEVITFIDWFYSEEAEIITTFGKEGVTYKESDGRLVFIDPNVDYSREYGLMANSINVRRHPDWFHAMNGPEVDALWEELIEMQVFPIPPRSVRYNQDEIDEFKLLVPNLAEYFQTMTSKFIFGDASLDEWDAYVEECYDKGALEISEILRGAYERQKAMQ